MFSTQSSVSFSRRCAIIGSSCWNIALYKFVLLVGRLICSEGCRTAQARRWRLGLGDSYCPAPSQDFGLSGHICLR